MIANDGQTWGMVALMVICCWALIIGLTQE